MLTSVCQLMSVRKPHLECSTGIEHFVRILPMMMASLRVHVPDSQRGIRIPVWRSRKKMLNECSRKIIIDRNKKKGKKIKDQTASCFFLTFSINYSIMPLYTQFYDVPFYTMTWRSVILFYDYSVPLYGTPFYTMGFSSILWQVICDLKQTCNRNAFRNNIWTKTTLNTCSAQL